MRVAEVRKPEDISLEPLQAFYDSAGLSTQVDSDGDLVVRTGPWRPGETPSWTI